MPTKNLNIVSVTAELSPFVKTGGLGIVANNLPQALAKLGHNVIIITPFYKKIAENTRGLKLVIKNMPFAVQKTELAADVYEGTLNEGVKVYFIDKPSFFSEIPVIYGSPFDNKRFLFFNFAVIQTLKELGFNPDIIQCHDWHTGLLPCLIHAGKNIKNPATVFTIHNLAFQLGSDWWLIPEKERDNGISPLPDFTDEARIKNLNFTLRGILCADLISTVSEHYAQEIMTKRFGENLERQLKDRRRDIFGIINGIDYNEYNPETDPGLPIKYNIDTFDRNRKNKLALQEYFDIERNPTKPLIGMVSRITEQKGFDLLIEILPALMKLDLQLVIMGSGDKRYEDTFGQAHKKYPKKFGYRSYDQRYETLVYSGSNFFLMPSRFEPCGLGQLLSLRYGSIPIVHGVGGLSDTVTDFNPKTGKGNGFVFTSYDSRAILTAIVRALENLKRNGVMWNNLIKTSMSEVYSWELPAKKYVSLFKRALRKHKSEK
ncbi:MAG: hypothetical protein A3A80_01580 [Candidatus Terrybacteria bacterium RIFCSPLOWO2_01_FULL_44_24]|uniref:Glycogen synthase n=1 Tax=Candidatus Terrybacteria bacterium RIFCSPHIGHO2_01_FULL_43_35 TaxID=1802361 RepID=A0A1G2PFP8_9BACT|nr:MAG: hypothetical protein A2828_03955 [Candidatus Terrybacteria bacterium RIFCSPHIGHO2_01_FULL_43_35]OHA49911.1 MAG: hypothetical protein A3B75_03345 [Candidatus Terrybacteria bacterium RIFCSPHIGHO2_02_FULL_43_14]OHA51768.1 MAG: hypothetical protein A3A80_01580 [Candidatus Terrybacteria bacterium RIFCSPLOWO2_01_FULL_44_24]